MTYVLHYAPDNASMIIRMALDHLDVPYRDVLVDRKSHAQSSAAYRALNPNGLIPTLETPAGPIFETGAILLWLADRHGGLAPPPTAAIRAGFLKWFFFLANTVHPALRMTFYADKYIGPDQADQAALRLGLQKQLTGYFTTLDQMVHNSAPWRGNDAALAFDFYLCALLRWPALYPADTDRRWFSLSNYPDLQSICQNIETLPLITKLDAIEGLGTRPFTHPRPAAPTIGSAT